MDERLTAVASARGGVFTSGHASALGLDDTALTRLRRTGDVLRLRRDAYALGSLWEAATPEQRLVLRARAVLASRAGGVATHQSALALHGLPLHGVDMETVDVRAAVNRVRLRSGVRTHPTPTGSRHVVADGYRCAPIGLALAQVAVRSGLLAALVPLDAALHAGRCSIEEVSCALATMSLTPRLRARGAQLLVRADPASESVGETRTRLLLTDLGLPMRTQVEIRDTTGHLVGRVDLLVGARVVVEFDGAVKYEGAEGRAALIAEKRREDALRALGFAVVRVTWADLDRPGAVGSMVRRAMAGMSARDADLPAS